MRRDDHDGGPAGLLHNRCGVPYRLAVLRHSRRHGDGLSPDHASLDRACAAGVHPDGHPGLAGRGSSSVAPPLTARLKKRRRAARNCRTTLRVRASVPRMLEMPARRLAWSAMAACLIAGSSAAVPHGAAADGAVLVGERHPLAVLAPQPTALFKDITGSPFYALISWLSSTTVATGWPDGTFRPLASTQRAAMAAFIYRYAGRPAWTAPAVSPFTDLRPGDAFYREATWAQAKGIVRGFPNGTLQPLGTVSRDQTMAFLYRLRGSPAVKLPARSPFRDVPATHALYREIVWGAAAGITTGWPDGTFRPDSAVTREAMAAFLYRLSGSPAYTPPPNPGRAPQSLPVPD